MLSNHIISSVPYYAPTTNSPYLPTISIRGNDCRLAYTTRLLAEERFLFGITLYLLHQFTPLLSRKWLTTVLYTRTQNNFHEQRFSKTRTFKYPISQKQWTNELVTKQFPFPVTSLNHHGSKKKLFLGIQSHLPTTLRAHLLI